MINLNMPLIKLSLHKAIQLIMNQTKSQNYTEKTIEEKRKKNKANMLSRGYSHRKM